MSNFEKEFNNCLHFGFIPNEPQNKIIEHFKYWQPPKPPVIVPQFVADFIKAMIAKGLKPLINSSKFGELGFTEEKLQEILYWINEYQEEYMRAWLDGYTVEKEQMFILKHIDMSKLYTDVSLYLAHGFSKELDHVYYGDDNVHNAEECHFTQSEIDSMETGSYEQIPVKVDEVEP